MPTPEGEGEVVSANIFSQSRAFSAGRFVVVRWSKYDDAGPVKPLSRIATRLAARHALLLDMSHRAGMTGDESFIRGGTPRGAPSISLHLISVTRTA
jgi:hypothetical protein